MKRFRRNTSGQFVVLAALLIATLTLSLALSIHQLNLQWQQLRYEPVEELVLGITSDLDRCLTHALSVASEQYYETGVEKNATSKGYNFISKWVRSVLASYSHLGIKMNMSVPINGTGLTDVSWQLDWRKEVGLSQVYTKFDLDVDAYGFKGWIGHSGRFVMLRIFPDSITLTNRTTTLRFQIVEGKGQALPIPNLTNESLKIWAHLTQNVMVPAEVNRLRYLGGGNYTVTFTPRVSEQSLGAQLFVVTPEDNIYVSAYYHRDISQSDIYVTLRSLEQDGDSKDLGQIQLRASNYTLPSSFRIDPGKYLLRYFAEEGYSFLNWTTDGFALVDDPSSSITSVIVYDNCTITAFYNALYEKPETLNLILDSRDKDNLTRHLGMISLNSTDYALPVDVSLTAGEYPLRFKPDNPGQYFQFWESSGEVIPASSVENPTTLFVSGNGTVVAVYGSQPPVTKSASVTLQSLEETLDTSNLGNIVLGTTSFRLPNSANLPDGTYLLRYMAAYGYTFLNWTTSTSAFVENPSSSITRVTIYDDCTLTAFYKRTPITGPTIVSLSLDSREKDNLTRHLGMISLSSIEYTLPADVTLGPGEYTLQFKPDNSSQYFQFWDCSGDAIPASSIDNPTTLVVSGNGTVVAVYGSKPPVTTPVQVTLQSSQDTLASQNLGNIVVGENLFKLPNSTKLFSGEYLLEYVPAEGYTFLNWTTTGGITVEDPYSSMTVAAVTGKGTITAFYRGCKIFLNSRHWADLSSSLGYVKLGPTAYTLPKNLTGIAPGNYLLEYTVYNESYAFLWWEVSGGAIPWDFAGNSTSVTIFGDGTLTAVYYLISEGEPPVGGDWDTLYLDRGYRLNPPFLWSGQSGHVPPSFSQGKEKQVAVFYSPPTPTIILAPIVNVTAYIRLNPPESVKDITMELGYWYNGTYYLIGTTVYTDKSQGVYRMQIDIFKEQSEFPGLFGIIPKGSVIVLTATVTFFRSPWGTFFVYYGPDRPTNIELYPETFP